MPYDDSSYVQMPFEDCTEDEYNRVSSLVKAIDLREVKEEENNTDFSGNVACGGGACEIIRA
jgi:ribonucleoside-diphosphate reductase alpha chain